jgi:hypothetical protein
MKIEKPKKNANGTYDGMIYKNSKKEHVQLSISNAKVVKTRLHNSDWYLYIQHPSIAKQVSSINSEVIQIVKENCGSWFKSSLSDELIEDYFTSNIIYDKEMGQVIRFKCLNDISDLEQNVYVNVEMTLKKIRFFKQKFVIEWDIEEIEVMDQCAIIDLNEIEELEDIPVPLVEEIEALKTTYKTHMEKKISGVKCELSMLEKLVEKIGSVTTINDMITLQDELDKILFS